MSISCQTFKLTSSLCRGKCACGCRACKLKMAFLCFCLHQGNKIIPSLYGTVLSIAEGSTARARQGESRIAGWCVASSMRTSTVPNTCPGVPWPVTLMAVTIAIQSKLLIGCLFQSLVTPQLQESRAVYEPVGISYLHLNETMIFRPKTTVLISHTFYYS